VKKILLFSLLFCVTVVYSVSAETYSWTDGSGTMNFTEDYSRIPKKYRKKARVLGSVDAEGTRPAAAGEAKKESKEPAASTQAEGKTAVMYGGKSSEQWKEEFRRINSEKEEINKKIEERRAQMRDSSNLSRIQYLQLQAQIKDLESNANRVAAKQNEMEQAASRAGVPYDLRR
jgi:chromosome segregation ATPase